MKRKRIFGVLMSALIINSTMLAGTSLGAACVEDPGSLSYSYVDFYGGVANEANYFLKSSGKTSAYNALNNGYSNNGLRNSANFENAMRNVNSYAPSVFNDHVYIYSGDNVSYYFNSAVSNYKSGNTARAYQYLGVASHYMTDVNLPYHSNVQVSNYSAHSGFEDRLSYYLAHSGRNGGDYFVPESTYSYMLNTSLYNICSEQSATARAYAYKYPVIDMTYSTPEYIGEGNRTVVQKSNRTVSGLILRFMKETNQI